MLEAEVRPTTDSEFSFPRPSTAKSFRRSLSAHPAQSHEQDRLAFVSAVHLKDSENHVLQSMCKLLTSLLRVPVAGKPLHSYRHPFTLPCAELVLSQVLPYLMGNRHVADVPFINE